MQKTVPLSLLLSGIAALLLFQAVVLYVLGQPPICECGYVKLWEGVVASVGNSQHVTDWYTPSHIIHGFLFFALFTWLFPRWSVIRRLFASLALEISWEVIENTPLVINHYREQALAQGYTGDSILNSVSDTVAMVVGFIVAVRVPVWVSVLIVLMFEVVVMYFIRDGLMLNIVNLIYPFDFIATWQAAGH